LNSVEFDGNVLFSVEYCTKLFKIETIQRFIQYFKNILSSVVKDHKTPVSRIEILPEGEKKQLLYDFNETPNDGADYGNKTIHRLFEEQVKKNPDRVAIVGRSPWPIDTAVANRTPHTIQLTYREMNKKTNRLAGHLRSRGVKPDTIVGLIVEPSVEMLIAIMGIMQAGGAYLPIELTLPEERIKYILEDANTKHLLIGSGVKTGAINLPENGVMQIGELLRTPHAQQPYGGPSLTDLAYVIYTAGSTGRPKGVLVEQRNLSAYVEAFFREFNITPGEITLQHTSFSVDAFVDEFFPVLIRGGRITVPSTTVPDI
ncbi:MAG: AMP-binding protein, partial [bacterium]|nr:AMP-binding protein [bacterium]